MKADMRKHVPGYGVWYLEDDSIVSSSPKLDSVVFGPANSAKEAERHGVIKAEALDWAYAFDTPEYGWNFASSTGKFLSEAMRGN